MGGTGPGDPDLAVVRMVEVGATLMDGLVGWVPQQEGSVGQLSMAEVSVLRDGLICERRAWVVPSRGTPSADAGRRAREVRG